MLRRLLYATDSLSAVGLLCVLILWPLSYCRYVGVEYTTTATWGEIAYQVGGKQGRMLVARDGAQFPQRPHFISKKIEPSELWSYWTWLSPPSINTDNPIASEYLGIIYVRYPGATPDSPLIWEIPFSYVAILLAILPTLAFFSHRRHARLNVRPAFPIEPTIKST